MKTSLREYFSLKKKKKKKKSATFFFFLSALWQRLLKKKKKKHLQFQAAVYDEQILQALAKSILAPQGSI